jgi:hypothetical protein
MLPVLINEAMPYDLGGTTVSKKQALPKSKNDRRIQFHG